MESLIAPFSFGEGLGPGFPSRGDVSIMVRKADTAKEFAVDQLESVKGRLARIEIDHAGHKSPLQRVFLQVSKAVGFSLAIVAADAEVRGEISGREKKAPAQRRGPVYPHGR